MLAEAIAMGLRLLVSTGGGETAHWDWQLTEPYDLSVDVRVLVLEPDPFSAAEIGALRARGVTPICYLSVGTWEQWRDDARAFPGAVLGDTLGRWPDERYLDIRALDVLRPLMEARIRRCAEKGFAGIEPDNIGSYDNATGFETTREDGLAYIRMIERLAAQYDLTIAQKNVAEFVPALVGSMDFMIVEECFEYDFCEAVLPYVAAGKDVLAVEYFESGQDWDALCAAARGMGFHLLVKNYEVSAGGRVCE